eukprot:scaffold4051_cov52-Attheya_sp.AAC.4
MIFGLPVCPQGPLLRLHQINWGRKLLSWGGCFDHQVLIKVVEKIGGVYPVLRMKVRLMQVDMT